VFFAQDGGSSSGLLNFLPIILIIGAMYFLLIRPQSKRRRDAMNMQSRLGPGDEIQTVGGLFGTVVAVDDDAVTIEAAEGVHLRFARSAIGRVISEQPKDPADEDDDDDAKTIENG
jgi:preprotein translocase subunit YajC